MADKHGCGWSSRWFGRIGGVWWHYDLTAGAAWSLRHLQRRGRFYGITLGQVAGGKRLFAVADVRAWFERQPTEVERG